MKATEEKQFDITDLNQGQKDAFDLLKDFVSTQDGSMFILKGYAGTGKTYLVKKLIKYINQVQPKAKIAVTAPTNKAVKVLSKVSNIKDYRIAYQTIHKLLGLTEEITNDGKQLFTRKQFNENEIEKYKYLIVDEVSMLNDELFIEIQQYCKKVKIIFMGDPAQIPPVNKLDCIPFNEEKKVFYDFKEYTLTEIMRQNQDNPIVQASFEIRNNLKKMQPIDQIKTTTDGKGHGIVRIDSNKKEDRDKAMKLFDEYFNCEGFRNDADHAKVIAWRNKTIDNINSIIRALLFGPDISKIVEGEKLIANKPIVEGMDIIIFNTSDEFEVEEYSVSSETVRLGQNTIRMTYYDCIVKAIDIEGKEIRRSINILHEDSEADFQKTLAILKDEAIKTKGANRSWLRYYEFMRRYADVNYNYAITAHKAQGSTYKNVFIIEDDIDYNPNIVERNRIKYTSYSRPTDKLFILKR